MRSKSSPSPLKWTDIFIMRLEDKVPIDLTLQTFTKKEQHITFIRLIFKLSIL